MRIATLLVTSILVSVLVLGQTRTRRTSPPQNGDPQADTSPDVKPGSVQGSVTSSVGSAPVRKATVALRNLGEHFSYSAISDAAGHFQFDNVKPGSYQISADSSGFMSQQPGRRAMTKPIVVAEEQNVTDVSVKLTPLGAISGHVLDADGEPLMWANVHVMQYFYQQGRKVLQDFGDANANDLGEFQLLDLAPGRYYIQVSAKPRTPRLPPNTRMAVLETAYPPTFYPNGSDVSQAKAIQIEAGSQITDLDVRLNEVPAHHIRGKAVDSQTGQPLRASYVMIRREGPDQLFANSSAQVEQDGTFDLRGVTSGSYALSIRAQASPNVATAQSVTVGDKDLDGVILTPANNRDIAGTVTVEGPPPDSWARMRVNLGPLNRMGKFANATIDSNGAFSLTDLSPAVYVLNANALPGKYVKSIRFADRDVVGGQIDLTQQADGKLEIILGSDGAQVQGGVQSAGGDPAVNALVTLVPKLEGRQDLFKVANTDQNGNFTFKDVAPGDYSVFAWQDIDIGMVQSPDFRKPFESKGSPVSLAASGQTSVQLHLISTDDVDAEKSKVP